MHRVAREHDAERADEHRDARRRRRRRASISGPRARLVDVRSRRRLATASSSRLARARAAARRSRARPTSRRDPRTPPRPTATVARIHALVWSSSPPSHSSHGMPLGAAVVVDEQLVLGVDRVGAVGERELEQLRLGDRLGRARLDAEVAVDAAQVVDLVDEAVALARRHRVVDRVVGAAHVDAAAPGTRPRTARSRCTSPCRPRSG